MSFKKVVFLKQSLQLFSMSLVLFISVFYAQRAFDRYAGLIILTYFCPRATRKFGKCLAKMKLMKEGATNVRLVEQERNIRFRCNKNSSIAFFLLFNIYLNPAEGQIFNTFPLNSKMHRFFQLHRVILYHFFSAF